MPPATLDSALRRGGRIGPYFRLDTRPVRAADGWRPFSDVLADPAVLRAHVDATRASLAAQCGGGDDDDGDGDGDGHTIDARAAASVHLLGLAARLVSPVLGAAVLGEMVPELCPDTLWWRGGGSGPLELAAPGVGHRVAAGDAAAVADVVHAHLVEPVLRPLVATSRREFRTSPRVLWGDVASAVGGAVVVLAQAEPTRARRAAAVAAEVLGRGALAGTARVLAGRGAPFRIARNSCCLYYRLPGGGTCGDCVLRYPPRAG